MDRPSPTRVGDHAPRPWVLAIVVLAVTAGCSPGAPTTEDPGAALPVATIADTVTVVAGPFDVRLVLDAILVPAERVPLDAPGTPSPLLADGTPVRRGDPVATAGPSPAELREARRALEDAQRAARAATPGSPEHQDQLVAVQRATEDLSARIVVTLASLTDVLTVPATAIRLDDARATQGEVLVTGASGTVATRVQLGPSDGVRTVVTAGLEPGAQVHRVHHGGM